MALGWALPALGPAPARAAPGDSLTATIRARDTVPPAPITDLTGLPGAEGQMLLEWTAPDANAGFGSEAVDGYFIRIATFSADSVGSTTTWWNAALDVPGEPVPSAPGVKDSLLLNNLEPGATYWAAIKSTDGAGNLSPIDVLTDTPGQQAYALVFDAVPPAPANLRFVSVDASSIALAWDAVPAPDLDFYLVYVDSIAPFDLTTDTFTIVADSDTTTLLHLGLTPGATYAYALTVVDKGAPPFNGVALESPYSNTISTRTDGGAPINPAISGVFRSSITVTWGGVSPDGGYVLEVSTANDFSGAADVSSITYSVALATLTVEGLGFNTTYYLQAGAVWSGTTFYALTAPISTATLANEPDPLAPAFLEVYASSISAQWAAGTPPNPAGTRYSIEASSTGFQLGTVIESSDTLSLDAFTTSLVDNTTYEFRVRAINHNSIPSSYTLLGATSTLALPPAGVSIDAVYADSMSVSWTPGNAQGYTLLASSTDFDGSGTVFSSTTLGIQASLSVRSLPANTTFTVRVGALNHNRVPNFSVGGASATLADTITLAQFFRVNLTSVTVNWNPHPAAPQELAAEGYAVDASTAADFSGDILSSTTWGGVEPSTLSVSGLTLGDTYYFRVGSLNWASAANYVFIGSTRAQASAPINPTVTGVFRSSITVVWNGVNPDGGYVLEASTASDFSGAADVSSISYSGGLLSLTVEGLAFNTTYYLQAGAVWSATTFYAPTTPISTATLANEPGLAAPAFPQVFTSSISAQWAAGTPPNPAGTRYTLEASSTSFQTGTLTPSVDTLNLSAFAMGLAANTTYEFRVRAINRNNIPSSSTLIGSTSTLALPPQDATISAVYMSSMSATWTPVDSTGYRLAASTAPDFSGSLISAFTGNGGASTLDVTGLALNTTYYLRVAAYNHNSTPNWALAGASSSLTSPACCLQLGSVGITSITINWQPLPSAPQDAASEGYVLEASTTPDFTGAIFSSTTASVLRSTLSVTALSGDSTYYFRVGTLNWESVPNYTIALTTYLPVNRPIPAAPFGIGIEAGVSVATITWMPVRNFFDHVPFDISTAPSSGELSGYSVYRATLPMGAEWNLVTTFFSTDTWRCVDNVSGPQFYYAVRAFNPTGESSNSLVRSNDSRNAWIVGTDDSTNMEIPLQFVDPLDGTGKTIDETFELRTSSHPEDVGGRVLKSFSFTAYKGGTTYAEDFELGGMGILNIRYETIGNIVLPSGGAGLSAVDPTSPDQMSVFWFDGSQWLQLFGKLDGTNQELTVETKYLGKFQLRSVERVGGFAFDQAGVSNRLITPNGDGFNDSVVFTFDNPRASEITGRIFDLKGAEIATMVPGPVSNSLMWDGKMNGAAVRGGVYIYQITGESLSFNGTVVVIK